MRTPTSCRFVLGVTLFGFIALAAAAASQVTTTAQPLRPFDEVVQEWATGDHVSRSANALELAAAFTENLPRVAELLAGGSREEKVLLFKLTEDAREASLYPTLARIVRESADVSERVRALAVIGHVRASSALPLVCGLTTDDNPEIRAAALYAMGYLGSAQCLDQAMRGLTAPEPLVRLHAAWALARLRRTDGEGEILHSSRSTDPPLRRYAIQALGDLGTTAAIGRLEEILVSPGETWKTYALVGLEALRLRELASSKRGEHLRSLVLSGAKAVSDWAVEELLEIDPGSASALLAAMGVRRDSRGTKLEYLMTIRRISE